MLHSIISCGDARYSSVTIVNIFLILNHSFTEHETLSPPQDVQLPCKFQKPLLSGHKVLGQTRGDGTPCAPSPAASFLEHACRDGQGPAPAHNAGSFRNIISLPPAFRRKPRLTGAAFNRNADLLKEEAFR